MFQLIIIFSMGATLLAAHDYSSSVVREDRLNNWFPLRYDTTKQYLGDLVHQGVRTQSRKVGLHDSARNRGIVGLHKISRNPMRSVAFPMKRFDDKRQRKTYGSRGLRKRVTIHQGHRGLLTDFLGSVREKGILGGLRDAVHKTVNGTAEITKGLIRGSAQMASDAVKKTIDTTLNIVNGTAKMTRDFVRGSAQVATRVTKDSAKLTKDLVGSSLDISKRALGWAVDKTIKIGKLIVDAPLRSIELTVNAAWAAHTFGVGLTAQIISDTADWFQGNWEAVKTVEFPGKNLIVMLYPSGLFSVVNKLTKEIMYMLDEGHNMMTHAFAYTVYLSLKFVFDTVNTVMVASHLDCVKLTPQTIKVNKMLVGTVYTKSGKVCGLSHLKPKNNVTITRNDDKFLIVSTPWVLTNLTVHLTGVRVTQSGENDTLLDDEVLDTTIKKIKATGTVSFEAGTLLRFVRINIKVDDMEGLNVKFPTNGKKSYLMEYIETLSDYFGGLVEKEVNHALTIIENKVFDYLANI